MARRSMSATRSSTTAIVVDALKAQGAIFVEELDEVPDDAPVVFSAHGVPKAVPAKATERGLTWLDATCPLVSKVHRQAERLVEQGRHILFIGHAGHPEVIGTLGQVPDGAMTLVETMADVAALTPADPDNLAFLTQTTLSVDDTAADRRRAARALPRRSRGRAARTSATPPPTARRRSRRSRTSATRCW